MIIGLVLGYKGRRLMAKLFGLEKKKEKQNDNRFSS